jgi:hypothetical protein
MTLREPPSWIDEHDLACHLAAAPVHSGMFAPPGKSTISSASGPPALVNITTAASLNQALAM